jgi:hypothetical protein
MSQASKNVHVVDENQEEPSAAGSQALEAGEGVKPTDHTKKVPLCEDVLDLTISLARV